MSSQIQRSFDAVPRSTTRSADAPCAERSASRRSWLRTCILVACTFALATFGARADASPADPVRVVATLQDVADIVREIGGDRVAVTTICTGRENLHAVAAKPSHLVALSKAHMFVQIGLSLEAAFVPGLLEGARNPRIALGAAGFVDCSQGWTALDVPESLSRRQGDVHPHGNPHMNLAPSGGRHIAQRVRDGLIAVDPANKALFEERAQSYFTRLDAAEKRWAEQARTWRGKKIVVYHKEFDYLAAANGLRVVGSIEAKPGIPPTPKHMAELISTVKREGDVVILTAPWSKNDAVAQLARETGARVCVLPNQCGSLEGTSTWITSMSTMHDRLAQAFAPSETPR